MAEVTLLINDLAAAVTPAGTGPLRGREFGALRVHSPASIAVASDRIFAVGSRAPMWGDSVAPMEPGAWR